MDLPKFTATYTDRTLILYPFTKSFTPWVLSMCDEVWTVSERSNVNARLVYHSEHRTFELAYATAKML